MVLPMAAHEGAWSAPLTSIDCEGFALGHKYADGGEGGGGGAKEYDGAAWREPRAEMTAVAEAWQRWRACKLQVARAAEEVGTAIKAYKEAEERCEAALTDVELDVAEDILDEAQEPRRTGQ